MVLNTTNRSTQIAAVNVRATIEGTLEAIKQLINDNKNTETVLIRKIKQKLGLIDRAINVFREDQKKILENTSDELALELLQSEVMNFIISVDQKTKSERLKETEHLLETAKLTLATA